MICNIVVHRYGDNVKIVHFIGVSKPWHAAFDEVTGEPVPRHATDMHASKHLKAWWQIYHDDVVAEMSALSKAVETKAVVQEPTHAETEPAQVRVPA